MQSYEEKFEDTKVVKKSITENTTNDPKNTTPTTND